MKNCFKILIAGFLLVSSLSVQGQFEINLCEGSGVHCMEIAYGDISVSLVKDKSRPEVIIKPKKS
jgi:hypothetical protein